MAEVAMREIQDEGEVSGDHEVVAKVIASDHEATERKDSEESKDSDLEGVGGFFQRQSSNEAGFDPGDMLRIDETTRNASIMALRFAIFADAVNSQILAPNIPTMCLPRGSVGAAIDSWEDTAPFEFSSAVYFVMMVPLLGTAISSTIVGYVSDKIGRKPCLLLCLYAGVLCSACNYLLRDTFWGFNCGNFVNGVFAVTLPVAMAYISDVLYQEPAKMEAELGTAMGLAMIGTAGGGVCAILMENEGLFTPLWLGAAITLISGIWVHCSLVEPSKAEQPGETSDASSEDGNLNQCHLANVVFGAFLDNFGSAGLYPLCLTPLAFDVFYLDQLELGETPIMSLAAYKWIYVSVALMVVPGVFFAVPIYSKLGTAGACVLGNFFTAVVTIIVLYIGLADPTDFTFGLFVAVIYVGFPLTVISQLTTGPMLDAIAPPSQRGYVQGLNMAVWALGTALSPFILGLVADTKGTTVAIWACAGISLVATVVNMPLIFIPELGIPKEKEDTMLTDSAYPGEDKDVIDVALSGGWVPAATLERINSDRMRNGQRFLRLPMGTYADDASQLDLLRGRAMADFKDVNARYAQWLKYLETPEKCAEHAKMVERASLTPEEMGMCGEDLGKWFADYLQANGYWVDDTPTLWKQMIMNAFPPVNEGQCITAANAKPWLLNYTQVLQRHVSLQETNGIQMLLASTAQTRQAGSGGMCMYPNVARSTDFNQFHANATDADAVRDV